MTARELVEAVVLTPADTLDRAKWSALHASVWGHRHLPVPDPGTRASYWRRN